MSSKKKSQQREEFKQEDIIQAVVIADSFNVRFAPITHNKPRVSSSKRQKHQLMQYLQQLDKVRPIYNILMAITVFYRASNTFRQYPIAGYMSSYNNPHN